MTERTLRAIVKETLLKTGVTRWLPSTSCAGDTSAWGPGPSQGLCKRSQSWEAVWGPLQDSGDVLGKNLNSIRGHDLNISSAVTVYLPSFPSDPCRLQFTHGSPCLPCERRLTRKSKTRSVPVLLVIYSSGGWPYTLTKTGDQLIIQFLSNFFNQLYRPKSFQENDKVLATR